MGAKKSSGLHWNSQLQETLGLTFNKLRMSLPLKIDIGEIYSSCFPPEFLQLLAYSEKESVVGNNFLSLLGRDRQISFMLDGSEEGCIYTVVDEPWPTPAERMAFVVPKSYTRFSELCHWLVRAVDIENKIVELNTIIRQYSACADSIAAIQATWPELLAYSNIRNADIGRGLTQQEHARLLRELPHYITQPDKKKVITALAKGSLIDNYSVKAWPVFNAVGNTPV